jgi:hypothetical protein
MCKMFEEKFYENSKYVEQSSTPKLDEKMKILDGRRHRSQAVKICETFLLG